MNNSVCLIKLDYSFMREETIGHPHGITTGELYREEKEAGTALGTIEKLLGEGRLGFAKLPFDEKLPAEVTTTADRLAAEVDTLVVLGIGGSALGNSALHAALNHPFYNLLSRRERNDRPRVFVLDNVDPEKTAVLLDLIDPASTAINIISKSGNTTETIALGAFFLDRLRRELGDKQSRERVIITTDPEKGPLRSFARETGCRSFEIPPDVGGRFSVLSAVGLFSAAVSGIEVSELLAGAREAHAASLRPNIDENPALAFALMNHLACTGKEKTIAVMMPYVDALRKMADWFVQLWAESLGKKHDRAGNVVHTGQTPLPALGATDQHSQVQLFMEGPPDKVITFIGARDYRSTIPLQEFPLTGDTFAYLSGKTMNELIQAEQKATATALAQNGRPSMTIELDTISPRTIGMLLYTLEMATAISGELYNINTYDQPGVEHGKTLTRKFLTEQKEAHP